MKLEIGQKWKSENDTMEVDWVSPSGRIGLFLCEDGESYNFSLKELEIYDYKLVQDNKEIPPDQTLVWVWENPEDEKIVRVSAGELEMERRLIVYSNGRQSGSTLSYSNWEVVK